MIGHDWLFLLKRLGIKICMSFMNKTYIKIVCHLAGPKHIKILIVVFCHVIKVLLHRLYT